MRVVIHDAETYEPITVVTIPNHYIREMEQGARDYSLRMAVPMPVSPYARGAKMDCTMMKGTVLRLRFEPIHRGRSGKRFMWLCTAEDGESALLLHSTFLPGQQKDVNAIERQAYLRGLFEALA